jgi:hypothetical protein
MPNSFDIPTTDFYIKTRLCSLLEAATGSKYNSCMIIKELEFYWEDVHLFNTPN